MRLRCVSTTAMIQSDMLRTTDLDYHLPPELIATRPAEPRDSCRLMVVSRLDESFIQHRVFRDLPDYLRAGDRLVFNTTRVLPARVFARREDTGGAAEGLYISTDAGGQWRMMLRAGSKLTEGHALRLLNSGGEPSRHRLRIAGREDELFLVTPMTDDSPTAPSAAEILGEVGATPLPPYILKARKDRHEESPDDLDRAWYQNVYADSSVAGSVAAPTAGLHFTPELLARVGAMGVVRRDVVLHVGPGTFKPVQTAYVEQHPMHSEWYRVEPGVAADLRSARDAGQRIIAVGTTSARTLETLPRVLPADVLEGGASGDTSILITPGHEWAWVGGMVTNFHLPRSTLLAMVGALFPAGVPRLIELYLEAVSRGYRFYSYGDAMLILP